MEVMPDHVPIFVKAPPTVMSFTSGGTFTSQGQSVTFNAAALVANDPTCCGNSPDNTITVTSDAGNVAADVPISIMCLPTVTKIVNNEFPNLNDTITYTITITNPNSAAQTVTINDTVDSNRCFAGEFTVLSQNSNFSPVTTPNGFTATGTLAAAGSNGASVTFTMTGQIAPFSTCCGNTINNTAQVTSEQVTGVVTAITPITITCTPTVTKSVDNKTPNLGAPVTYTITITNPNNSALPVSVADALSSTNAGCITFNTVTADDPSFSNLTIGADHHSFSGTGTVPASGTVTITLKAMVSNTATCCGINTDNIVMVTSPQFAGARQADATAAITCPSNLSLKQAIVSCNPNRKPFNFKISVKNNGQGAAQNVQVLDCVTPRQSITSITAPGWDCSASSGQTVNCKLATLAAGATAPDIIVNTTKTSSNSGSMNNVACVSSSNDAAPCAVSCAAICAGAACPATCNKCSTLAISC